MIYELRSYYAVPGKMPALDKHLEFACRQFPKHGLEVVGAWTDEVGRTARMTYMWAAADEAARNAGLAAFAGSAEWRDYAKDEQAREGNIVARVENTLLRTTPYSPTPKISGGIQELRVYHAMPGRLPEVNARFANHTLGFFKKHGVGVVGFWTEVYGTSNRLVYMTEFENLAARETLWSAFAGDPEWHKARAETEKNGPLVEYVENWLLKPARFAQ